ncbi:hypothetical protein FNU76_22000 [Chitinimonas arctica]|uniref:Uncharacterized protein n=1 Tax=Chitinimonas arctica TaxID=2594795 RepID=A0A516SLB3_9NEIS|nr:hypothetical protein [Chitinimonas arctica]QDQ28808.1 hypothetical protein FNU76_22000 [Chitinimonas arctica]
MKIFAPLDNIDDAIDAILTHGIAAIEGEKAPVIAYAVRLMQCLEPYRDVAPIISYQNVPNNGYLYYVFDSNRYATGDEELKQAVFNLDTICFNGIPS